MHPMVSGTHVEILDWLDDHARYALSVTAHRRVTGPIVLAEFRKACLAHGIPASTLTDNGMVFTTRLAGAKVDATALKRTTPPGGGNNSLESSPNAVISASTQEITDNSTR
jgi:hypothetical protein